MALIDASRNGEKEKVKELLKSKEDVNRTNNYGRTALFFASEKGYFDIVNILIRNEARVNVKDKAGLTPLCIASEKGHSDVVRLLLENDADVEITSKKGWTPLKKACMKGNLDVIRLLLKNGADISVSNNGYNALQTAAKYNQNEVEKLLLKHMENLNKNPAEEPESNKSGEVNEKDILKLSKNISSLIGDVDRIRAELDKKAREKEDYNQNTLEEIEKLRKERSTSIFRLATWRTQHENAVCLKTTNEIESEVSGVAQMIEAISKPNYEISALLESKKKFDEKMEVEIQQNEIRLKNLLEDKNGEVTKRNKIIEELEQKLQDLTDQNQDIVSSVNDQNLEISKLRHEIEKLNHEIEKLKQISCESKQETNNIFTPVVLMNQNYGPSSGQANFNVG